MIHTSLWQNEQFAKLSDKAKLLYIGTITIADDDGRLKGNSLILKGQIFPLDEAVTSDQVRKYINECVKVKLINYYEVNGQYFLEHPNWQKFQTLRSDRKKDSEIPSFSDITTDSQPGDNQMSTNVLRKISKDKISKDNNARKNAQTRKNRFQDETPMTLDEYVTSMKSSPLRHVQIIGEWAEAEGPKFTTKGQWHSFTSRNARIAKTLTPYSSEQIEKAYHLMLKDVVHTERGKKVGFISKYTLETLAKYIDRI